MFVDADHREHRVQVHSGRLHGPVPFDVVNGDAGIHESRKVFESRVLVHVTRSLEIADLVGEQFFGHYIEHCSRLILVNQQLGERLDLPASAITEAIVEERLHPLGVPETTLAALRELFQTCNLARYAPIRTSQELAAIIPKFEAVLRDLQGLKL